MFCCKQTCLNLKTFLWVRKMRTPTNVKFELRGTLLGVHIHLRT